MTLGDTGSDGRAYGARRMRRATDDVRKHTTEATASGRSAAAAVHFLLRVSCQMVHRVVAHG